MMAKQQQEEVYEMQKKLEEEQKMKEKWEQIKNKRKNEESEITWYILDAIFNFLWFCRYQIHGHQIYGHQPLFIIDPRWCHLVMPSSSIDPCLFSLVVPILSAAL